MADKGYFVLNDTVLAHEFDAEFNRVLTAVWLSEKSNYPQLRQQLLDKSKASEQNPMAQPETAPLDEENANPELPPNYKLHNRTKEMS